MIKKYLSLLIITIFGCTAYSQQDPHYTMYMYNMNIVNPAYAGSTQDLNIGVLARRQWVGINGSPSTYTANIHSAVGKRVGMGLSLISDEIGPQSEQNLYLDLSYTIPLTHTANLSFGVKGGGTLFSIRDNLRTSNDNAQNLNQGINEFFVNIGAGIFYHTNKFYLGVSLPNVLRTKHLNKEKIRRSENVFQETEAQEIEHFFITSGYVFNLKKDIKLKPSLLSKVVPGSPISIDLSLNVLLKERLELGISHRLEDSWSAMVNFSVTEKLRIGYAYDHTISELSQFSRGSHEFLLLYSIPLSPRGIVSPRFF